MRKILVTGGTGTIGSAFIEKCNEMPFCMGHSEKRMQEFLVRNPSVPFHLCAIENREEVFAVFDRVRPDIVVHAAAIKHVNFAAQQPIRAIEVNIQGSLNVVSACRAFDVPIAVAVSSDKAANPCSVYGYTKLLMEKCFVEANYAACRFGNVVGSSGSVVPIWLKQASKGEPLALTDPNMNRFMFSIEDAVDLVQRAIDMCDKGDCRFVLTKLMKFVNIFDLATCVSTRTKIIGSRPGERLDEILFNADESARAEIMGDFVRIGEELTGFVHRDYTTEVASRMSKEELEALIEEVRQKG